MYVTDQACLLKKTVNGENHLLLSFFMKESGLLSVLSRRSSRAVAGQAEPDLFETGEISLERKGDNKPAFLREFHPGSRFPGIARHYGSLTMACRLARFYELNLRHMETFDFAWELLQTALSAFSRKNQPQAVLLKAYFLFARNEGYPVKEEWLANLPADTRSGIASLLRSPVGQCEGDPSFAGDQIRSLETYFIQQTDLILPEA